MFTIPVSPRTGFVLDTILENSFLPLSPQACSLRICNFVYFCKAALQHSLLLEAQLNFNDIKIIYSNKKNKKIHSYKAELIYNVKSCSNGLQELAGLECSHSATKTLGT